MKRASFPFNIPLKNCFPSFSHSVKVEIDLCLRFNDFHEFFIFSKCPFFTSSKMRFFVESETSWPIRTIPSSTGPTLSTRISGRGRRSLELKVFVILSAQKNLMLIFADAIRGFTTRASSCGPRRSAKLSIDEKRFDFSEGISCISHPYSFFSEKRDKQYKRVTNTMSLDAFPRKSNFRSHSEKSSVFSSNCKLPTLNNNHTENKMCTLRPWSMAQEELTKYKSSLKNT